MSLPPFDLHRPETLEEVFSLLETYGDDAVVMQGGTELLLLFKLGLAAYGHVVDLSRVAALRGLDLEGEGLRVGAATTHLTLERSALVQRHWPALALMARGVANLRVRAAGTIGGNLAFAEPHSDPATFLLAAEGVLRTRAASGARSLAAADFVVGPYETALAPGELLLAVELPLLAADARMLHVKLAFHERPAVTVSCLLRGREEILEARVAVGSIGAFPARAVEAEALLRGLEVAALDEAGLAAAADAAAEEARPVADASGAVDYKRALVRVLVRRTLAATLTELRR